MECMLTPIDMGGKDKYSVKGRIIIDTYGWNRYVRRSILSVRTTKQI